MILYNLSVELGGPTIILEPALMYIVELLVILQISASKDFQEVEELRIGFGKSLDWVEGDEVVELEAGGERDGSLDKTDCGGTGSRGTGLGSGESLKGA